MSLTLTLPADYDGPMLRRALFVAFPALLGCITYTVEGDQITLEELDETDRAVAEQVFTDHAVKRAERQAIIAAYQANQAFLALPAPTQAQALAQVKALTRQMNYVAKTLFDRGTI